MCLSKKSVYLMVFGLLGYVVGIISEHRISSQEKNINVSPMPLNIFHLDR